MKTAFAALALALCLAPTVASADRLQTRPTLAPDGAGGLWLSGTGPAGTTVRHLGDRGVLEPRQPATGWALDPATSFIERVLPDGAGGAITISYGDPPSGPNPPEPTRLAVRHFAPGNGPTPRYELAPPTLGNGRPAYWPLAVADGRGGVFAVWSGWPGTTSVQPIVAHLRWDGDVDFQWGEDGATPRLAMDVVTDGAGGCWVATQSVGPDVVGLVHVDASGVGHSVPDARFDAARSESDVAPALASDGAGGVVIAWAARPAAGEREFRALHVRADGTLDDAWPAAGYRSPGAVTGPNRVPLAGDGAGGGYLLGCAVGVTKGTSVRRFDATGRSATGWPERGVVLSADGGPPLDEILSDGEGGVLAMWAEPAGGTESTIRAKRLTPFGTTAPGWRSDGVPLITTARATLGAVSDGAGGLVLGIAAGLDEPELFLHASGGGTLGTWLAPEPTRVALGPAVPQPTRGAVSIRMAIPRGGVRAVRVLDVAGRLVRELDHAGMDRAGEYTVRWDGRDTNGRPARPGVYLVHVRTADGDASRRVLVVR